MAANQFKLTKMIITGAEEMSDIIKAQISSHPLFPNLLSAYIDCTKMGAPEKMASSLFEKISKNKQIISTGQIGADHELDKFMMAYCEVLHKYKEGISKLFDQATIFLRSIQSQLTDLCRETIPRTTTNSSLHSSVGGSGCASKEDEIICKEVDAINRKDMAACNRRQGDHQELKEMLLHKYSGYLINLKTELLKKRKICKLPKDARTALLEWWNSHNKWPYPTEEEKNRLSEITRLDQKQINNWFTNQRKRYWRPMEDMKFALMEGTSGGVKAAASMYFNNTR